MQFKALTSCCLASVILWGVSGIRQAQPPAVRLLQPRQIPNLPASVRTELERLGCEIPQNETSKPPNNVVSGEFAKVAQKDWAALCAQSGKMRVVVIWGGRNSCSAQPSNKTDPVANIWSQQQDGPFETYVALARPAKILRFREFFGNSNRNPVTHDGIEYGGGNASVIYYCDAGNWLELQGDD